MDEIMRSFDTNVFATIRTAKAVIPHMAARKRGTVVNVGSIAGIVRPSPQADLLILIVRPIPWSGVYSATKAALHSLTDALYMECKPLHIHVVRSNFVANQGPCVSLPPDSLYGDYIDAVLLHLTMRQTNKPLPADVFARRTVDAVLSAGGPPRYMSIGWMAGWYRVYEWLPRRWVLDLFWKWMGEGPRKAAQKMK
ncbi:hypothetical protein GSI_05161 [Ganoderma sinense ZZ0214-1]|uniref:Uncharacterized protein n=1 Tax=Ganoderma sinense ZZ0214-1 TaxID=1077348 RepID=A0A2G8SFB9_9APHY|nr:hypothetical protein GSI_05161 [Ganoderma sinense ZZ0214-1]